MNYTNIKTKDWGTKNEKNRERKKGLGSSLLKIALLTAVSIPLSWCAVNGLDNYLKARDQKYLEKNNCKIVNKLATVEDARDQYQGIARRLIRQGKHITLGKDVGIERLSKYISESNNNRVLKKGEYFNTYECEGCK